MFSYIFAQVLESSVKNCGSLVHNEIATKEFMEFMKDQAKVILSVLIMFCILYFYCFPNRFV